MCAGAGHGYGPGVRGGRGRGRTTLMIIKSSQKSLIYYLYFCLIGKSEAWQIISQYRPGYYYSLREDSDRYGNFGLDGVIRIVQSCFIS